MEGESETATLEDRDGGGSQLFMDLCARFDDNETNTTEKERQSDDIVRQAEDPIILTGMGMQNFSSLRDNWENIPQKLVLRQRKLAIKNGAFELVMPGPNYKRRWGGDYDSAVKRAKRQ